MSDEAIMKGWWRPKAACKGMDTDTIFYPEHPHTSAGDAARAVCEGCPVRKECLEWAMATHEPDGIWGGRTWRQRRRLGADRRRRARGETTTSQRKHEVIRGPGGRFMGSRVVEKSA